MVPRSKKQADKRPRESSSESEDMNFTIPEHRVYFERLSRVRFGQTRFLDTSILRDMQQGDELADEVEDLVSVGGWRQLLTIREPAI